MTPLPTPARASNDRWTLGHAAAAVLSVLGSWVAALALLGESVNASGGGCWELCPEPVDRWAGIGWLVAATMVLLIPPISLWRIRRRARWLTLTAPGLGALALLVHWVGWAV